MRGESPPGPRNLQGLTREMYGIPYLQTEGHRHADPGALKDTDGNIPAA